MSPNHDEYVSPPREPPPPPPDSRRVHYDYDRKPLPLPTRPSPTENLRPPGDFLHFMVTGISLLILGVLIGFPAGAWFWKFSRLFFDPAFAWWLSLFPPEMR